ncbi:MAG TPA: M28 family peptidase, partial [Woeseiaceae bacterium]|nr:M28 family peptidase [Woeseiaceae bacterium]
AIGTLCMLALLATSGVHAEDEVDALIAAMLGDTPIVDNLRELTDSIGGRATGSPANEAAVEWALDAFQSAGVTARAESFEMPMRWHEREASAMVSGDVEFATGVVAKPFSTGTERGGLRAPLVDGGEGGVEDFAGLGDRAAGSWIILETPVLDDEAGLAGLFEGYGNAAAAEARASEAGVAGIVFMSTRRHNLLYRLFASRGVDNALPILVMEREDAKRIRRLLQKGRKLSLTATIDVERERGYQARNVIGEIRGGDRAGEIVVFGAHLDSFDLGTGALDNGANVAMLIDVARQIRRLALVPARTIRFALWNGEEQGLIGSWRYTEQHADELDHHALAASFDIGTGAITGFFTNGRQELVPMVDRFLQPVAGLGPFTQVNVPVVGTDNFDFMIQGVPNLIAIQADANYASNYHAESDTFDKVDQRQLKLNSAIAAALIWGFANGSERLPRQTRAEITALIESTDLEQQMRNFGVWNGWAAGERGRQ